MIKVITEITMSNEELGYKALLREVSDQEASLAELEKHVNELKQSLAEKRNEELGYDIVKEAFEKLGFGIEEKKPTMFDVCSPTAEQKALLQRTLDVEARIAELEKIVAEFEQLLAQKRDQWAITFFECTEA